MKSKLYAVRDIKVGVFAEPFPGQSEGAVLRGLKAAVEGGQGDIAKWPADFDLYEVAEFNSEDGTIQALMQPRHITNAGVFQEVAKAMKTLASAPEHRDTLNQ